LTPATVPAAATLSMWPRLLRFLIYNVVFALVPLMLSIIIRQLSNVTAPAGVYAPELLFFAVMVSATALGEISDEARLTGSEPLFQILRGLLMIGAVGAGALFGMYQFDQIVGPGSLAFRENITILALVMGIIFFILSMAAEVLLGRIQRSAP